MSSRWNAIWEDRSARFSYSFALILSVFFVVDIYPLSFLAGRGHFFESGDAAQHVTGWLFYARDLWHAPPLHTERLNYPEGVSIAFTDSIPVAALFFKAIAGLLPPQFHYIGLWQAFAYISQSLAATFLMRALGLRHVLATFAAVMFCLSWPALTWRSGHTSLMTHGLILCAFAFYWLGRHDIWSGMRATVAFIVLAVLALMIHPYLVAMCYPIFLAFLVDRAISGEGWKAQFPRLAASIAACLITGAMLGYFAKSSVSSGFGYYSLNLLSPFCGGRFYACSADATGGQLEGFSYFGLGLLFLIAAALMSSHLRIGMYLKHYPAFLLMLFLFFIYALSNEVYAGSNLVFSYSLPAFLERLTGTFRASARFFWPVSYFILFATLVITLRKKDLLAFFMACGAFTLQWIDTKPLRDGLKIVASAPEQGDMAAWTEAMKDIDQIRIYPSFGCGNVQSETYLFFQRLAAYHGKLLSTGYIARPDTDCFKDRLALDQELAPRHLYVASLQHLQQSLNIPLAFQRASQRLECIKWQDVIMCKAGGLLSDLEKTGLQISSISLPAKDKEAVTWQASTLPTLIGKVDSQRLVPAKNKAGYLSFGPYVRLPAGRYRVIFEYSSQTRSSESVGKWDVVASEGNRSSREIVWGSLDGTDGQVKRVEGVFSSEGERTSFEFRTYFAGSGDLQLVQVVLRKVLEN